MQPIANISALARNLLWEFLVAQDVEPEVTLPSDVQHWRPPDQDSYKLNFDAAFFKASNTTIIGVIACSWRGEVIGTLSQSIPASHLVAYMEAQACERAIQFAVEIRLRRVVFEGDSALVINAITQEGAEFSSYGNIIDEICWIAADLKFVKFDHVSHVCNCVVDVLAKKAKNILGQQVWMEDPPNDIVPLLLFDVH